MSSVSVEIRRGQVQRWSRNRDTVRGGEAPGSVVPADADEIRVDLRDVTGHDIELRILGGLRDDDLHAHLGRA